MHANRLYLGGSFSWVDTPTDPKTDRSRVAAFNLKKGGTIIRTWSPDVEGGSVYDLVLQKGWLTKEKLDDLLSPANMTDPRQLPT